MPAASLCFLPPLAYTVSCTLAYMLTLSEAAARLGVQAATLRRQVHRKKLRARKRRLGGYEVWVITELELERYAMENKK